MLDGAHAAAGLHRNVHRFADALDRREVFARSEGAVEVDHVQALRACVDEGLRAFDRIAIVLNLGRGIALLHADALAAAQVDRRHDQLISLSRRLPGAFRSARTVPATGPSYVACGRMRRLSRELLQNVAGPAGDTAARKETGELVAGNSEIGKHRRGVEVDVCVDRVAGLFLLQDLAAGIFDRARGFVPAIAADVTGELLRHRFEVPRARIADFVFAMAHAHDALSAPEEIADVLLGVLGRLHFGQRAIGGARGSAVQIALQRRKRRGHRCVDVGARRSGDARRKRRCVERMIGEQHEVGVERVLFDRVRHLARAHVEEVAGLRKIGTRRDRIEASANSIPRRDDRRHLCDELDRRVHVGEVFAVRVDRREKAETADDRAQHVHRPGRLGNVLHCVDQRFGKRAAGAELALEDFELVPVRKMTVEQEMDDLFERRVRREIVDVVAAIG